MYINVLLLLLLIKIIVINGNINYNNINTLKFTISPNYYKDYVYKHINILQLKKIKLNIYNKIKLNYNKIIFNTRQYILDYGNNDDMICIITSILL